VAGRLQRPRHPRPAAASAGRRSNPVFALSKKWILMSAS
jgi:hypothetical protein